MEKFNWFLISIQSLFLRTHDLKPGFEADLKHEEFPLRHSLRNRGKSEYKILLGFMCVLKMVMEAKPSRVVIGSWKSSTLKVESF